MPAPVADKTVLVQIEKLIHGGAGLAYEGSLAVFVPGVLPGESVSVHLERQRKGFAEGRLLDVVSPSSDRVEAPCAVYGQCGGCQLQHATAAAQLTLKRNVLAETLARVGGLTDLIVPPLVPSPEVFGYRNRARFAVAAVAGQPPGLAYYEEKSHRPVRIETCLLLPPALNDAVRAINDLLAVGGAIASNLREVRLGMSFTSGELVVQYLGEHATRRQAEAWFAAVRSNIPNLKGQSLIVGRGEHSRRWTDGNLTLAEAVAGVTFLFGERSFTQANFKLNETLVRTVMDWVTAMRGSEPLRVLELYAGVGNFGLPIAREGALVTLVEGHRTALTNARETAKLNRIRNCRFRSDSAEAIMRISKPEEYDVIVLDPPRSGLSKEGLAELLRLRPRWILYLSCDPPTVARDVRGMRTAGYHVSRIQGFDMFPQTMHVETLVELTGRV